MTQNTIRVYGAGGSGLNLVKQLDNPRFDVALIDSSESNMRDDPFDKRLYKIQGLDGAGKLPAETFKAFHDKASEVLSKFPASETLNIVVYSLGGGTGSMAGPIIIDELMSRKLPVLAVCFATDIDNRELGNSVNSLVMLDNIASEVHKQPISVFFLQPSERESIDRTILRTLEDISLLADPDRTEEFDTADLKNFCNFSRVAKLENPGLSLVRISSNEETLPEFDYGPDVETLVASSILVTTDNNREIKHVKPEHSSKVIVLDESDLPSGDIRFDNIVGVLPCIIEILDAKLNNRATKFKSTKLRPKVQKKLTGRFAVMD